MSEGTNCTAVTLVTSLEQLRAQHEEPLISSSDDAPSHMFQELRTYLTIPDSRLRLVALSAYSPEHNADEAIWN